MIIELVAGITVRAMRHLPGGVVWPAADVMLSGMLVAGGIRMPWVVWMGHESTQRAVLFSSLSHF
jgi:hypothetical protein